MSRGGRVEAVVVSSTPLTTPLTTARHHSISEELNNMPQATGGHPWLHGN